jgi:hypothetical protein
MNTRQNLIQSILGEKGAEKFEERLKMFSVSDTDAQFRRKAFAQTIENTLEINDMVLGKSKRSTFAGASLSSANLAGTSIYAGVMRSFVQSIAPIFAVQRNIDAPEQKIMYVDFYDILNNNLIVPNIGPDQAWADQKARVTETIDPGNTPTTTITAGSPIVPKTFKAEIYNGNTLVGTIIDDGAGKFFATPGLILATSSIVYQTGSAATVTLNWATGLTATKMIYAAVYDQSAKAELNKAYGMTKYYDVQTSPILVPVERNVISDHAMAKQGIIDSDELYANFVENEYTKVVNQRVFDALVGGYTGDTYQLDLSAFTLASGFYDTIVRSFKSLLAQAENQLAAQTYKGAKCTGYLADPVACNIFDYMVAGDGWVKNINSTYYKDIFGWYNDVPVVRCTDLGEGEIMLTHRTADGYVAPLYHAMFLAPTELPVVANYQNMTKYATGMYSMEGINMSSSKLCVKLKVVAPSDLTLTKL